jgi:hypothetical protein
MALDERERKEQRSGYEVLAPGVKASRLRVVLQFDRDAPWIHVQWILLVCAEQRMPKIAFAVRGSDDREFWLDATLPTDRGIGQRKPQVIKVSILIRTRLPSEADWRKKRADMPAVVRYRFGDQETEELASVARWLSEARKATTQAEVPVHGEIRATGSIPYHHVAKLLAEFRTSGYAQVDFFGTQIPDENVRTATELPRQSPSWPAVDDSRDPRGPQETLLLEFRLEDGDRSELDRAVAIVRRRLRVAGHGDLKCSLQGEILLIELPVGETKVEEIRDLVERRSARLEFHITVEPNAPNYDHYWQKLKRALAEGAKFDAVRDLGPGDRAKGDIASGRYPLGLRWHRLSKRASDFGSFNPDRLPAQPYVLCANDDYGITERSLRNTAHRRDFETLSDHWMVTFEIKEPFQKKMAKLTSGVDEHLAIVLDGEVHAAPVLRSSISSHVQISGRYTEQEARNLAALLGSEPLPVRFALAR